jgi:aminopeptidase N
VAVSRGQEASYDSLRSALEQSTNRNLAKLFRVWLNEKGIPQDFRDRYPLASSEQEKGE